MARWLWPNQHKGYEQMCALAATGQLGGPQMFELNEHIATCGSCRKFLESVSQVSVRAIPVLACYRASAEDMTPPEGIRARFLSRLAGEGRAETSTALGLVPGPDKVQPVVGSGGRSKHQKRAPANAGQRSGWVPGLAWAGACIAACLVVGAAAFHLGERRAISKATAQASPVKSMDQAVSPEITLDHVRLLDRQRGELARELTRLKANLADAVAERVSLSTDLADTKARLAAYTVQAQGTPQKPVAEVQEAKNQIAILQGQVGRLNQRLTESEVGLGAQKQMAEELAGKLEATEADLRREQDLKSAKSELGDLVAARNLHIVDVYDADGRGKRQQPFGRVFYIENKSLVFYAYDLENSRRLNAKVIFHVWGEKAGINATTHSLGLLHNDDANQGRWAMTFDDPKVLAQINSVFVTAESANKRYDGPHGKKVLYAYFGSQPNHP